jgi:hypothetical protein
MYTRWNKCFGTEIFTKWIVCTDERTAECTSARKMHNFPTIMTFRHNFPTNKLTDGHMDKRTDG